MMPWHSLDATRRSGLAMGVSVGVHLAALGVLAVGSVAGWFRMHAGMGDTAGVPSATTSLVLADLAPPPVEETPPPPAPHVATQAPPAPPPSASNQDDLARAQQPQAPRRSMIEDAPPTTTPEPAQAPRIATPPVEAPAPSPPRASFAGVEATPARRIVYLIDGSGSMAASLAFVQDELVRSVERLHKDQQFQVIVYREQVGASEGGGNVTLSAFATAGGTLAMTSASREAKQLLGPWLEQVRPSGRSDPRRAIEAALTLQPDIIFVLTRAIARSGVDVNARNREVLAALDRLNPADSAGSRPAKIKAIQFLEDDPTGLLQELAAQHGGGPASYRLVTRAEIAAARRR